VPAALQLLLVFLSGVTVDVLNVFWIHFMERNRPYLAATVGAAITATRMLAIVEVVHAPPYIGALVAGEWFGCFIGIHLKKKIALPTFSS
jgi:hypothetical protein